LNLVKRAGGGADVNRFVVIIFIDMGGTEQNPVLGEG
jgi:hypothetical protein